VHACVGACVRVCVSVRESVCVYTCSVRCDPYPEIPDEWENIKCEENVAAHTSKRPPITCMCIFMHACMCIYVCIVNIYTRRYRFSLWIYICIYINLCFIVIIYMYIYIRVCEYIKMWCSTHLDTFVYIPPDTNTNECVRIFICIYLYIYIYIHLHIYIYAQGGVGYFWNERGFSVESSLQRISSSFWLWKRKDSSVVL